MKALIRNVSRLSPTINGRCSKVGLALTAVLTKVFLLKYVSSRCLSVQVRTLPPWHQAQAGPDLLSKAWWSSWTLPPHETSERFHLETEYDRWTQQPPVIKPCFPISQATLEPYKPATHGETRQIETLTTIGHGSTGAAVERWVFFQRQGQGQQPKDSEGQHRIHGSFVQAIQGEYKLYCIWNSQSYRKRDSKWHLWRDEVWADWRALAPLLAPLSRLSMMRWMAQSKETKPRRAERDKVVWISQSIHQTWDLTE